MSHLHRTVVLALAASVAAAVSAPAGAMQSESQGASLVEQSQQQLRQGHADRAMTLARQAMTADPKSAAAHMQVGILLDLDGKYAEARPHLQTAIDLATSAEESARALRSMAMSYAFEGKCKDATPYEEKLYGRYLALPDYYQAGEIADELARVCLESGDYDAAEAWYRKGYEAGLKEPNLSAARRDLWTFRWESAQARIAARRGDHAAADRHVAAAKAALDTGTNPQQAPFLPYLTGYVAFYAGEYQKALADFATGNQNDPFVLSLTAQALEKTGQPDKAMALYKQIMASTAHNPTNAFARPLARERLAGSGSQ
jgi:Flp pilus assembly protein TadD